MREMIFASFSIYARTEVTTLRGESCGRICIENRSTSRVSIAGKSTPYYCPPLEALAIQL